MQEFVKKIKEKLNNNHRVVKTDEDLEWNRAIYYCEELIEQITEEYESNLSENLTSSDGWIPCSERLPEESERWLGHDIIDAEPREFIVMVKGAYEPTTGYYTVDGWVKDIYNKEEYGYADEIIAWMPLPEPFREKEGRE